MATPSSFSKYRSWSTVESEDPNDIGRIYVPKSSQERKIRRTFSTWAFSLIILSLSVVFLIGLLVGYFLKDSQENIVGERRDKLDAQTLRSVHENVMYFISNENVRKISSDLNLLSDKQTEYVKKEFQSYGLDRVEVQEYDVVVTYPDPNRSNLLVLINGTGLVFSNLTLSNANQQVKKILKKRQDVTRLRPHTVQGELVYADFGRRMDLARKNRTVSLKGKVLMIRHGDIPVHEKITVATTFGVRGILLYGKNSDSSMSDVTGCKENGQKYKLAVQSISGALAQQILKYYANNNRNITVRITSNNVQLRRRVRNVVGSIMGDLERDRIVMIGASRSQFIRQVGTSYMLELARSFKDMQKINGWTPRRSVQFYSWDHDSVSNIGFDQYSKRQNTLTDLSVVGYINLDILQAGNQSHWLHITGDMVFSKIVKSVVKEVPDPSNANLVLQDTWEGTLHQVHTDQEIKQLGIPLFRPAMSPTQNISQGFDEDHHFMYSLAVSRVASLVTLKLLDNDILPFNMTNITYIFYNSIVKSVQLINEIQEYSNLINTDILFKKAEELKNAGKTFSEYVPELVQSNDILAVRRINDAIIKAQRILWTSKDSRSMNFLLQISRIDGSLSSITELLSISTLTNDYIELNCLIKDIVHTLQEVITCLQSI